MIFYSKDGNKVTLHGNGFQALEWNDVIMLDYDVTLCVQKIALFHQEDHLISRIFHSRANNVWRGWGGCGRGGGGDKV